MPAAIPFLSPDADGGGLLSVTDNSTGPGPIRPAHSLMGPDPLTGASQQTAIIAGSGKTNVYVGVLVLFALLGMVAFHYGGFDAHLFVGRRS